MWRRRGAPPRVPPCAPSDRRPHVFCRLSVCAPAPKINRRSCYTWLDIFLHLETLLQAAAGRNVTPKYRAEEEELPISNTHAEAGI